MKNNNKIGFDQKKYLELQTSEILQRVDNFGQLYLEVGGKLVDDLHAKRVLPGFDPKSKLKVLSSIKDKIEVIVCISAVDLERNKIRSDNYMSYADESIRLIEFLRKEGILVNNAVITLFDNQRRAVLFKSRLEKIKLNVHLHSRTPGYPTDVDVIVSSDGYGRNSFIETERDIVVVTAPGPSSGKMATCLSQIYHESLRGNTVGYAKYETFPVWDLPLDHPVNVAYESATLDLMDINMIDPFHFASYDKMSVNYNRDIETFPVLKRIFDRIYGKEVYKSPTDMGVNVISQAITDDEVVKKAARQEVIRRYYTTMTDNQLGDATDQSLERAKLLLENLDLRPLDRAVAKLALDKLELLQNSQPSYPNQASAIQLVTGESSTGKKTPILTSTAAAVLNILKIISNIDDKIYLLSPEVIGPINDLKCDKLGLCDSELSLEEVFLALTISAVTNPMAKLALDNIGRLKGAQLHSTGMMPDRDKVICRRLEIDTTIGIPDIKY